MPLYKIWKWESDPAVDDPTWRVKADSLEVTRNDGLILLRDGKKVRGIPAGQWSHWEEGENRES